MSSRILLVEDEHDLRDLLAYLFETHGYEVTAVRTGEEALSACEETPPDIVVLDVALPGISGLEVCGRIRSPKIPVIMLSSLDRDDQVVAGLQVGADDYVRKPFNHKELLLRIERLLEKRDPDARTEEVPRTLRYEHLLIDLERGEVVRGERRTALTPTETRLLEVFGENLGYPVRKEELLQRVWDSSDWTGADDLIKVNIRRLRKKIEVDPKNPKLLINRWGRGYMLVHPGSSATE